ncbi:MAG: M24 family metallopeptidase, partial [Alphaproteobacteria bacterium]
MEVRRNPAFADSEFRRRLDAVGRRMEDAGLDALLVTTPENICYLSGFETPGYYYPQALIVPRGEAPVLVIRRLERGNFLAHSWLAEDRCEAFQDHERPMEAVARAVERLALAGKVIGVDLAGWFFPVRDHEALKRLLPNTRFRDASLLVETARAIKSPPEIAYIREAARLSGLGVQTAVERCKPGATTENELAAAVYESLTRNGSEYAGLPVLISSGARTLVAHATPTGKVIEPGDNVLVELTGVVRRYAGPIFRTLFCGRPSPRVREIAKVAEDMLAAVMDSARPGATSDGVNAAAARAAAPLGAAVHKRAGYSVGLNFAPDWG